MTSTTGTTLHPDRETERPTFVLVWADGTVVLDDPLSQGHAVADYLTDQAYGTNDPGDVPAAVYGWREDAGPYPEVNLPGLAPVKIEHAGNRLEDNDWIYLDYRLTWVDTGTLITTITIRVDGRA